MVPPLTKQQLSDENQESQQQQLLLQAVSSGVDLTALERALATEPLFAPACGLPECEEPCYMYEGVVHGYCGRTHADEAVLRGLQDRLRPPHGSCYTCQLEGCSKNVNFDPETGRAHDFCSRYHAAHAIDRGLWPPANAKGSAKCRIPDCDELVYCNPFSRKESEYCSYGHVLAGKALGGTRQCSRPGCTRVTCFDEDTGQVFDLCGICANAFCSRWGSGLSECSLPGCVRSTMVNDATGEILGFCCEEHHQLASQRSMAPKTEQHVARTYEGGTISTTDFKLSLLTNAHPDYARLKTRFLDRWLKSVHANGIISVQTIFKVEVPQGIRKKHEDYVRTIADVRSCFHGTSCSEICDFFVHHRSGPCGDRECNVCNICTHGFTLNKHSEDRVAKRRRFPLRFGQGLYFTSVSGKANDYAKHSEKDSVHGKAWKVRCMFLARVAVGKAYVTREKFLPEKRMCPPPGYDSVYGEPGKALKYDEVVVYKEEAALPTHLIVYAV